MFSGLDTPNLLQIAKLSKTMRQAVVIEFYRRHWEYYDKTSLPDINKKLMIVARLGFTDWVQYCLDAGANIHACIPLYDSSLQAIHLAAQSGNVASVTLLHRAGARCLLETPTKYFLSPLHYASESGNSLCIAFFLDLGVPVDQQSSVGCPLGWCWTALQIVSAKGFADCATLLLSRGAKADFADPSGFQAIHRAAANGHAPIVAMLLAAHVDPSARNEDGLTPLIMALGSPKAVAVVEQLLVFKPDLRTKFCFPQMLLPLQELIYRKNLPIAAALLKHDAELVNVQLLIDGKLIGVRYADYTALHVAAERNYTEGVTFLLEHGANINSKTESGYRPYDLVKDKNSQIAHLLKDYGLLRSLKKRIRRMRHRFFSEDTTNSAAETKPETEIGAIAPMPPFPRIHGPS
jgi:ankyrin repeat protein